MEVAKEPGFWELTRKAVTGKVYASWSIPPLSPVPSVLLHPDPFRVLALPQALTLYTKK